MAEPTDSDLDYRLRRDGFIQNPNDPNDYYRRETDGTWTTRYTDGDWSQLKEDKKWEQDHKYRNY